MFVVGKEFHFSAAHFLTKYHGKCERLHGHNYRFVVSVCGKKGENGMVVDFMLLKKLVTKRILKKLDHQNLNDFFDNPTAENITEWIWSELNPLSEKLRDLLDDPNFPVEITRLFTDAKNAKLDRINEDVRLFEIEFFETETSLVRYRGGGIF